MNWVKKNIALIVVILFLVFTGFTTIHDFLHEQSLQHKYYLEGQKECQKTGDYIVCSRYFEPYQKMDTITSFEYMLFCYDSTARLQLLAPLLVIIVVISKFHTYFHKTLKNSLTRVPYHKFLLKNYINVLKYSFIIPVFLLSLFIIAYFISGNFDYKYSMKVFGYDAFGIENAKNWLLFLFVYLFNFILRSIFWINIGLYNCKCNKNKIIAIIISYVEYIMIFLVLETAIGETIFYQTDYMYYLLLTNVWAFSNVTLEGMTLMSFALAFLSLIILIFSYKDKESVLLEVEK